MQIEKRDVRAKNSYVHIDDKTRLCVNCNQPFSVRDPESMAELRCVDCQVKWRAAGSPPKPSHISWLDYVYWLMSRRDKY